MSNTWTIILIVFMLIVVSVLSFELGIPNVSNPDSLGVSSDNLAGAGQSWNTIKYFFAIALSFFQILTFQTNLPPVLNLFIMVPMSFGIFFIIVTIVRGGAR